MTLTPLPLYLLPKTEEPIKRTTMARNRATDANGRVPPGQFLVEKWPVLSYGPTPRFNPATWDFRLFGLVEEPRRLNYQQFRALPQSHLTADFHCVTTWSRLDNAWEGVLAKDVVSLIHRKPAARYVMIHCDGGYTTNLSLEQLLDDDVIFAHRHDGRDLEPDHGWPLRLVVPKLYAWKSAKWVRGIEFLAENRRGFWEVRGYHNRGNPWNEERYSDQEED
jgi:DMSO/TMAO reductase YedYZ molybdopterin-dependent catalytic subunit